MIQTLRVKNLAIADNVSVEFGRGLNVITGETGAGKSILVGALNLLLGARADRTLIRSGEESCTVEAAFDLADPAEIDTLLDELGIEACDGGRLIVRRVVAASGTNKVLINDCTSTVQALKQLGNLLVDLHGPYDHQSLLDPEFQLNLLDSFGHTWKTRAQYETTYESWRTFQRQRDELAGGNPEDLARELELLQAQIQEIDTAEIVGADEEAIAKEHAVNANAQQILIIADGVCDTLMEGDNAAFDALTAARRHIGELRPLLDEAEDWERDLESACILVQELDKAVRTRVQRIEADPTRLQWLEDRMALIHRLKRKYGGSLAAIEERRVLCQSRLDILASREDTLKKLDDQIHVASTELQGRAKTLSGQRATAAKTLAKAVTAELRDLGFPHGGFNIDIAQLDPGPTGCDQIDFGFAPNMGEPMRPLRLIASSGEISRVMLATKSILASHDKVPILVFDEIDANVGGEMGNAIGEKLSSVSQHHQVLCITHLPQVAVFGDSHFLVFKEVSQGRTHTRLRPVAGEDRAEEVARMLGGRDLTKVTLEHARQMITRATAGREAPPGTHP